MKPAERDELLVRVDERVKQLKDGDEGAVPEILKHLIILNGKVQNNARCITKIKATLSVLGTLVVLAIGGLSKWFGLW